MRGAAGARDDDLETGRLCAFGEGIQPFRGAMGRDDARFAIDSERGKRFGGVTHGLPIRLASHDDGYRGGHLVNSVRESRNIGRIIGVACASSKAWQGVRNGLSCLGKSGQASSTGFNTDGHEEKNQGGGLRGRKKPQKRGDGAQTRARPGPARVHAPVCGGKRRQINDLPAEGPAGRGAGTNRGAAGVRRNRLPAGYPEPARF